MTENKPKPQVVSNKKNIYAVIGIIVLVIIVVFLLRKPAIINSVTTPTSNQDHEDHEGHVHNDAALGEVTRLEAFVKAHPDSNSAVLSLAHLYQDNGYYEKAINAYSKYLEKDMKNTEARIDMGVSYYQLAFNDTLNRVMLFKRAISEMEKALIYSPNHELGNFNLGIVNFQSGNLDKATEYFKKCISINPKSAVAQKAKEILDQHINIKQIN
jgi:tetratricopeptide (TPR) repeat protein